MMKKWDIVIIVVLILISFIPHGVFYAATRGNFNSTYAEIHVNGILYKKITLKENSKDTFTIKNELGMNVIEVSGKRIRIIDADCPDKVCEQPGFISKPGQSLVCLPHKLIVEIKGEKAEKQETDVISY